MIKKSKKIIASLLVAMSLVAIFPATTSFAFTKEENEAYLKFLKTECTKVDSFVYKRISDGKYFGSNSDPNSDDKIPSNKPLDITNNYFAASDGSLVKNQWESFFDRERFRWHYYGSDYKSVKGYQIIDGKKYYFNKYGILLEGWTGKSSVEESDRSSDNYWYYFGEDGAIKAGWVQSGGNWYYIYADGSMASNTTTPDGFYVNKKGVWVS